MPVLRKYANAPRFWIGGSKETNRGLTESECEAFTQQIALIRERRIAMDEQRRHSRNGSSIAHSRD
jgi:hypothetical protein